MTRATFSALKNGSPRSVSISITPVHHNHARASRTPLLFWHKEKYIPERGQFKMTILTLKKMHFLTTGEVQSLD